MSKQQAPNTTGIGTADLQWHSDETPYSPRFDDIYYAPTHGAEESTHVFLEGINAPACWQQRPHYTLAETGFGTGLNFLLTLDLWLATAPAHGRLHYIAVEAYPMDQAALARAHAPFAWLAPHSAALVQAWPPAVAGFHQRSLAQGRVTLTLLFGPAASMLAQLSATVDGWYLDGFAPSRNPEMWSDTLFAQLSRLSRLGTRLASFTVAGTVKRGLRAQGFTLHKAPGFGQKRECLRGVLENPLPHKPNIPPWYAPPQRSEPVSSVAIIGAGIAGAACAYACRRAGLQVTLFERHAQPGAEASGNPSGLFSPRLTAGVSLDGRFHAAAYFHALDLYAQLAQHTPEIYHPGRGLLQMAESEADVQRLQQALFHSAWPPQHAQWWDAATASQQLGTPLPRGGLWHAQAGALNPSVLCAALLADVTAHYQTEIVRLAPQPEGWTLHTAQRHYGTFDAVVIAAGATAPLLYPEAEIPNTAVQGQLSILPAANPLNQHALVFGGYLTPPYQDEQGQLCQVLGSTYRPWDDLSDCSWSECQPEAHQLVWQQLNETLPQLGQQWLGPARQGRAALRAAMKDHFPLFGPLINPSAYRTNYATLYQGKRVSLAKPAVYIDGLYLIGGLGSRGLLTAPLFGACMAALLSGGPLPLEADLWCAVHPARLLVRSLKKPPL
ncbi:protein of unknown function DUF752 [Magnetococcus marinus MC-1]|uniref:tRNA 5-methylaminomethyl-2-thiouridine biosynthesis bifunctional protein MnmC n=1 Tax=Magnetococcus marinus (strain ATCC BAA-1437 / JCM 17883 / MC-1) TaxID=156889 RepID=MNMC_MAGMM|nr:bifunctional tRNA (5-methylaminomethyl-2-thiouridine)(34)-methyltransferase MnmD/FAD-dependent 5-carboxymethylaminomethyl-2-thiouridine(34) oxidoreductase MnmC [Magnetococcus marinus]A0LA84.1 RecName: Full=tRNA 5-methylaminomethyl-2-thiouridine biosynthesis bifunctional protein MnmC; Short=tRNA mnm(5)s(2)U biosynthesis bifunctional protein; Includes: RecName: Full=tRNA (mnm(5)s(2)U34)-methyltransferase; Includes: RecName: Full=FAD-dependent cmnm(5)s(2)U34 oxidoreductase [Magnetococcus marinus M